MVQAATVLLLAAMFTTRSGWCWTWQKLTRATVEDVDLERRPVAGAPLPPANDLLAATLGPSGGVAAGRMDLGGLGVALPCASAKRSRILPEVDNDCSYVGCRLSPRDKAIIREFRFCLVARTVSLRRRICGRAMELVNGHESCLALGSRGGSLNP